MCFYRRSLRIHVHRHGQSAWHAACPLLDQAAPKCRGGTRKLKLLVYPSPISPVSTLAIAVGSLNAEMAKAW
jgi:hypothetical protein